MSSITVLESYFFSLYFKRTILCDCWYVQKPLERVDGRSHCPLTLSEREKDENILFQHVRVVVARTTMYRYIIRKREKNHNPLVAATRVFPLFVLRSNVK